LPTRLRQWNQELFAEAKNPNFQNLSLQPKFLRKTLKSEDLSTASRRLFLDRVNGIKSYFARKQNKTLHPNSQSTEADYKP